MAKNKKNANNTKPARYGIRVNPDYVNITMTVIMAAVIVTLLAVTNANYLRKIEALSLFLPTSDYYTECMRLPGGWLTWVSTFLTQTFCYPWLGAMVYAVILMGTTLAVYKAFRLPKNAYPALLIIPGAILLALLNLGYVIFSLKTPGYAFLLPIGTLCCVLTFWGYRTLRPWWLRLVVIVLIATGGYVVAGFYAMLTAVVCAVYEGVSIITHSRQWWQHLLIIAVGGVCVWQMPEYWVMHADTDVPMAFIYSTPLPRFVEGEDSLFMPYILICVTLAILAAVAALPRIKVWWAGTPLTLGAATVGLLSVIGVFANRYDDSNLRLTLDLDRALWNQQWTEAVDRMAAFTDEPTRLNVILSNMALLRSGEAPDRMFTMPNGSAPYATERALRATHDAGSMMFSYHTGLVNYAYRWAMEYKVEYGMNVEQLKYMTKCALLNGDYDVARKCLDTLGKTAFHRSWADRYRAYVDNPSLIDQDAEMSAVKALMTENNTFIEDKGQLEGYVWPWLANLPGGNADVLELSLLGALTCRQIDAFAERLPYYARLHEHLPRHFQEGILMWSRVHENTGFRQFNIDQEVKDQFKNFLITQKQYSHLPLEQQAQLMRPAYGHTYWYYALYMRNLQII